MDSVEAVSGNDMEPLDLISGVASAVADLPPGYSHSPPVGFVSEIQKLGSRAERGFSAFGIACREAVRKREADYDDLPGCKCAHAASSSARFQSSASAASLNRATSCTVGASSRIVTSARRGDCTRIGSTKCTSLFVSMTASTVFIWFRLYLARQGSAKAISLV